MDKIHRNQQVLSSVKNALRILRSFSLNEPEKKVSSLAEELGLGKSTVSRLLATLASEGFVIKDQTTRTYGLGLSILNLNTVLTSKIEVNRESLPILQQLVDSLSETAHIATLAGTDVVYLNRIDCRQPVSILSHIGRRNPVHCTSSGKVLLAYQSKTVISQFIERGLERYSAYTITDPDEFRAVLQTIRANEYATSSSEIREGTASVAAPIRDYTGRVVYAVTVVGPARRLNVQSAAVINKVKEAARDISGRLGFYK